MICVSEEEKKEILRVIKTFAPDYDVLVFGSRYKWDSKDHSDIDLVFAGDSKMPPIQIFKLREAYDATNLPYRVDILDYNAISESFRKIIDAGNEVIYKGRGKAKSNWTKVKLKDICAINQNTYSLSEKWDFVNYLETGNITDNRIDTIWKIVLDEDILPGRARRKVAVNDILYSMVRPNQRHYGIIKEVLPNMLVSTGFAVITADKTLADSDFLYYYLTQDDIVNILHAIGEQSAPAYPSIMPYDIESIELFLPPLSEQIEIGQTLRTLDDKIANNTAINHHLEQMAQAIFKSWFVDFEPFADGEFVESELGEIPVGWQIVTLDEVCTKITDGSHFSPMKSDDGLYPMFSVKDMEQHGFNYQSCKMISADDFEVMITNDCVPRIDDILVAKDGSYLKHIFIVNEQRKEAILSSIAIFRPNSIRIFPEILLCFLKYPSVQQTIKDNFVSGSALPRIVLKDFKKLKLILPPITEQGKIAGILSKFRYLIALHQEENNDLTVARDILLPRMMSGELSVANVDCT